MIALIIAALGVVSSITGILSFIGINGNLFNIHPILANSSPVPTPTNPQMDIELVPTNGQRILVEAKDQIVFPGNVVKTGISVTVSFTIINNGANVAYIRSIVIGARGPGISCEDKNSQKWAAPQMSFASPANIILQPGQEYIYKESRAFYIPGNYFFEPVVQGPNGDWGGIVPFSCVDITVQ